MLKGEPRGKRIRIKPKEKMSRVCNGQGYKQAWGYTPHALTFFRKQENRNRKLNGACAENLLLLLRGIYCNMFERGFLGREIHFGVGLFGVVGVASLYFERG